MEGINYKYPRQPIIRVSHKHPCPVCGHPDWCSVIGAGARAICMRVQGDRPTRNGGYLHILGGTLPDPPHTLQRLPVPNIQRAEVDHLDAIFCTLLHRYLVLAEHHRADLRARGLDDDAIEQGGYRSVPSPEYGERVARALSAYGLEGIPGFFKESGGWCMVTRDAGFYVPVRDNHGRIVGLQIRRHGLGDGRGKYVWFSSAYKPGGTSSRSPLHYAKSHLLPDASEVLITEGALKADIISHFLGCPVIAAAGVSNFGHDFEVQLRVKFPRLHTTIIAFDSDWRTKSTVRSALMRLQRRLWRVGFKVVTRTWPAKINFGGIAQPRCTPTSRSGY